MRVDPKKLKQRVIKKAKQSPCRHRVVAVGIDRRGRIIDIACNRHRFHTNGGGWHAEELLMFRTPRSLSKILIARVRDERFLPIDPCEKCRKLAQKQGVKIERLVA